MEIHVALMMHVVLIIVWIYQQVREVPVEGKNPR